LIVNPVGLLIVAVGSSNVPSGVTGGGISL
jgi:hypothetical protein